MARNHVPVYQGWTLFPNPFLVHHTLNAMQAKQTSTVPRAVVHKRILDAAEAQPHASLQELASQVSGATVDLVERVLDTYGDPSQDSPDTQGTGDPSPADPKATAPAISASELTDKQRETLRLVYENPTASQRDIAAMLGVTHAAVYQRLQPIDGFDWADRWSFVTTLFDEPSPDSETTVGHLDQPPHPITSREDGLGDPGAIPENPHLTLKVLRACLEDDTITDDELYQIMIDLVKPPHEPVIAT